MFNFHHEPNEIIAQVSRNNRVYIRLCKRLYIHTFTWIIDAENDNNTPRNDAENDNNAPSETSSTQNDDRLISSRRDGPTTASLVDRTRSDVEDHRRLQREDAFTRGRPGLAENQQNNNLYK